MKVLLTGASGFIGSFLAETLLKYNYHVRCLLRRSSKLIWLNDLDIECTFGKLDDLETIQRSLQDVDFVFHAAGITKAISEEDFQLGNVQLTQKLCEAILKGGFKLKRLVHISSQAAAGPSPTIQPINEETAPNPINLYGKSKLAAEKYVQQFKQEIPSTIIRPPAVYGPRDKDTLQYYKLLKRGIIPNIGGRDKYLSLIYVKDLVAGIIQAAESPKTINQIYFLAMEQPYSWDEFAHIALGLMRKKALKVSIPEIMAQGISRITERIARTIKLNPALNYDRYLQMKPDFWICSAQKAKRDFGFQCTTLLEDGIHETVQWYVKQGWL